MNPPAESARRAPSGDGEHADLIAALRRVGALPAALPVTVESLTGGVSNDVVGVTGQGSDGQTVDVVVKRALPRLRVETEWLASPTRVLNEARALQLAATFLPDRVPAVLAVDPEDFIIVIERAPRSFAEWRTQLLAGHVDTAAADQLGRCLAAWHRATTDKPEVTADFGDATSFGQLRVDPFYRSISTRHPSVSGRITAIVDRMLSTRRCLVHGDFSPKNVLVGDQGLWVIDWEVAHLGDPVFDLAFMIAHLVCKRLHRPADAAAFQHAAEIFLFRYLDEAGSGELDRVYLVHQVACLVLARIDGKSPATYLDETARRRGRRLALSLLQSSAPEWPALWVPGGDPHSVEQSDDRGL